MLPEFIYENFRRVCYENGATFIPVCPKCGRFVKSDKTILENGLGEIKKTNNATCSKCGRVEMPFEGFISCDA